MINYYDVLGYEGHYIISEYGDIFSIKKFTHHQPQ